MRSLLPKSMSLPLALTFLAAAPAWAAPARPARPATMVQVDQRELLDELRALQDQVRALESRTNKGKDGRELKRGLDSLGDRLARLERSIRSSRPVVAERLPPRVVVGPTPMTPATFATLHRSVAGQSFGSDKLVILRSALRENFVAVEQARALMGEFMVSRDRLDALRLLWPRVVDRENGYRFYEDFVFASEKNAVQAILDA